MATMYATDTAGADRKRKAVQRMRAAQLAAQMLQQATQRQGVPADSPTPGKPELPHRPMPGGPDQGRPIVAQPPYRPSLADAQGLDPQLGPALAGARRYADGLAGRAPFRDSVLPRTDVPDRGPGLPGKPVIRQPEGPSRVPGPTPGRPIVRQPLPRPPGRPQINPLEEQLAQRQVELLGRTQKRPRSRRGGQLLAQILGGFSRG